MGHVSWTARPRTLELQYYQICFNFSMHLKNVYHLVVTIDPYPLIKGNFAEIP